MSLLRKNYSSLNHLCGMRCEFSESIRRFSVLAFSITHPESMVLAKASIHVSIFLLVVGGLERNFLSFVLRICSQHIILHGERRM